MAMPKLMFNMGHGAGASALIILLLLTAIFHENLTAAPPVITLIRPFDTNGVTIHFDTEADREYILEYTDHLPKPGEHLTWSNLYTAPNLPFPNHYVILDTRTKPQRFYRLEATP
jgi:hypothetical protein